MIHLPLPHHWTATAVGDTPQPAAEIVGQAVTAAVLGCLHTDPLAAACPTPRPR